MIVIIDYNLGNKASIQNMIHKIGYDAVITNTISIIEEASHIIIPGVGAYDEGMMQLQKLDLISIITHKVIEKKTPILGICLGFQLLCKNSEEGTIPGLGLLDAQFKKFPRTIDDSKLRSPHLGWKTVSNNSSQLLQKIEHPRFYFVHSYYGISNNTNYTIGETTYGIPFISLIEHANIFGVQFHPEKSHSNGKQLLHNFLQL